MGSREHRAALSQLPPPELVDWGSRPPFSPITSRTLAAAIGLDDLGVFGVWRYRGLGPQELPPAWFRGRSCCYTPSSVSRWLAERRGEALSEIDLWSAYLTQIFGTDVSRSQAPALARKFAESAGPRAWEREGIRFVSTRTWLEYLDRIGSMLL